jgi:hypothetical protein
MASGDTGRAEALIELDAAAIVSVLKARCVVGLA